MEEKIKELLQEKYKRIEDGNIPSAQKTALKKNKIDKDTLAWFFLMCECSNILRIDLQDVLSTNIAKENNEVVERALKEYKKQAASVLTKLLNGKI